MSIGEALAAARRRAGLTVSQVSERTRVREAIIRGIESDDYSGCGGDFYARGHIRAVAKVTGVDPEPLIREYNTTQRTPQPIIDADVVLPATPVATHRRRRLAVLVAVLVVVAAALGVVTYHLLAGSRQGATVAASAQAHRAAQRHGGHGRPNQPPKTGAAANASASLRHSPRATAAAPARPTVAAELTPVAAVAFGPEGAGQGDNPQLASLVIDGNLATAWRTDWYTTARFGNLYPATGLLVDMGHPVTITAAQITLGSAPGAGFQLRVGSTPALADLLPVARAAGAGGVVRLRLTPAHGRYLLIWFTQLPPDPAGTFQVSVHDVKVDGQP